MKADAKNILPRLKVYLLSGKKITHNQALKKFRTNRLSEYIHRLRFDHGMTIDTEMVKDGPDTYGVYYIPKSKKQNKILTGTYLR